MKKLFFSLITLASCAILYYGCRKDKTPMPVEPCDPNKVYFQNSIRPIINSNCAKSGCHDAITREEGLDLSSYSGIMKIVKAGRPSSSEIMEKLNEANPTDRMPPAPESALTQEQKDLIARWIREGALDTYCEQDTSNCSAVNVSYTNEVASILNINCMGCHSGNTVNGGVNLSDYPGVAAAANSGKLYNAVVQNGKAVPMPPSGKLAACDLKKIKAWIDEGVKNN
jgi:uncharacterized membrane protein